MPAKLMVIAAILAGPFLACAQTQLDLGLQGKHVDFGNQSFVRPFRTGASLPATCSIGEMFFNTTAPQGSNTFGCVAPNVWTLESGGAPFQVARTSSTVLTIGGDCTVPAPCRARSGAVVYTFVTSATVTLASGSGLAYIYVSSGGVLTVGVSSGITSISCVGCTVAPQITQFPVDSIPLMTWNATLGSWDAAGTEQRAILSAGRSFSAGSNVTLTQTGNNVTISASGSGSGGGSSAVDMTVFDKTHIFAEFGFSGAAPWAYTGASCLGAVGTAGVSGEPVGLGFTASNAACFVYYPGAAGLSLPFVDFASGSAPAFHTLIGRYSRGNSNGLGTGDHYIGWSSAKDGTVANFIGIRYSASSGLWQCIIRAGGSDVAAQTISSTADAAVHTFSVTNSGVANSVTCLIGSASSTVTGTIPANSWFAVMGSSSSGSATFTAIEARIHFSGLAR